MLFVPLLSLLHFLIISLINLLPLSTGFDANFQMSLSSFFESAYAWNEIFPIDTLLAILVLVVSFELSVFGYKVIRWIYHLIRGQSLKGQH